MFDDIQENPKPTPQTPANALDNSGNEIPQPAPPNQIFTKEKSDSEPEDIFDEIDDGIRDAEGDYINQPPNAKLAANFRQNEEEEEEIPGLSNKKNSKIRIIIIIVIVFLVAIGAAWLAYAYFIQSSAVKENNIGQINSENTLPASANTNNQNLNKDANINANVEIVKPIDTDGDGLTDNDEIKFGTDPSKTDTDGDGLTDQEEVIKYKTNPHNADSDSDGYKDGDEVKNGYNPAGEGKLIDKIELP